MKINISAVLEPVKKLITNLQHLHDLHHKYKCYLTFGQFLAVSISVMFLTYYFPFAGSYYFVYIFMYTF